MNSFRLLLNAALLGIALSLGFSTWNVPIVSWSSDIEFMVGPAAVLLVATLLTVLAGRRLDSTTLVVGATTALFHQGFLYLGAPPFAGAIFVVCPALSALRLDQIRSGPMMAFWTAAALGVGLVAAHVALSYPLLGSHSHAGYVPPFGLRAVATMMAGIIGILPLVWNRMFFAEVSDGSVPSAVLVETAPSSTSPVIPEPAIPEHSDAGIHI